jgi:adenylylsulfate kinase
MIITREDREKLNRHKSCVLWFTGLSGSGKSTLAVEVEKWLYQHQLHSFILDGDNLRHGLNRNLDFTPEDRTENIRRMGETAKLFVEAGMITLVAAISPFKADREMVRSLFKDKEFIEIYVKCSIEECERRDPKGLYKKALSGEITHFTGISSPYEEPDKPEILLENDRNPHQESAKTVIHYLKDNGYIFTKD